MPVTADEANKDNYESAVEHHLVKQLLL